MAGSEKTGVDAADADLFVGSRYLLTPMPETPVAVLERMERWVMSLGARPVRLEPLAHDQAVAGISHLPHVAAAALATSVRAEAGDGGPDLATLRELIAGGFRSTTRIAASSPEMWRDICLTNREALTTSLEGFEQELARFRRALETGDGGALLEAFARAQQARLELVPE
jgi:prephenate dehydrogenase